MAGFDYARSRATADRLIVRFGRAVPIKRAQPAGNPWDPPLGALSVYEAKAAVLPASQGTIEAFDNRLEGGTLIEENLRFLLMSAEMKKVEGVGPDAIEPKSGDVVHFDGERWVVLGCTPMNPAGTAVYSPASWRNRRANGGDGIAPCGPD